MSKVKFNLYGDTFSHLTGGNLGFSTHGKRSKYVDWVQDGSSRVSFYIDEAILLATSESKVKERYAWLLESKCVKPWLYHEIETNIDKFLSVFKLIFTNNVEFSQIDPRIIWCPASSTWIKYPRIYPKEKDISFITSRKMQTIGHKVRSEWLEIMRGSVDVYGRGVKEIKTKEEGLVDYRFSVVIENCFYKGYFTEKLLDCFATGTIPIYKGAPDIGLFFDSKGIMNLEDYVSASSLTYDSKIESVRNNFEALMDYPLTEDYIYMRYFS